MREIEWLKVCLTKKYRTVWRISLLAILTKSLLLGIFQEVALSQNLTNNLVAQLPNSSSLEKAILAEINRARTDPQSYADWLEDTKQYYDGMLLTLPGEKPIRTNKGLEALEEAIEFLDQLEPLSPLTLSEQLTTTVEDNLGEIQAGNNSEEANISYGRNTATGIVMQLVVDDGFRDRRHRTELFNPDFQVTGIACDADSRYDNICLINYDQDVAENPTETESDFVATNEEKPINLTEEEAEVEPATTESEDSSSQESSPSDTPLILEKIQRGMLEEGDTVIPNDGSLYDSYPLEGEAGDSFLISVESEEFDTFLAVMDAEGNILEQNDDVSDRNSNSRLKVTLPKAGVYNVIVNAYDQGGRGNYVLTVRR